MKEPDKLFGRARAVSDKISRFAVAGLGASLSVPITIEYRYGEGVLYYEFAIATLISSLIALTYLFAGRITMERPTGKLVTLIRAFVVIGGVSVVIGLFRYRNLGGVFSFAYQLLVFGLIFIGLMLLKDESRVVLFFRSVLVSSAVFALGLLMYIHHLVGVDSLTSFQGIWTLHNDMTIRSMWFGWPNAYGCFLAIVLSFGFALQSLSKGKAWLCYLLFTLIVGIALLVTFSRSGYFLAVVSLLVLFFSKKGLWKRIFAGVLLTAVGLTLALALPAVTEYLSYSDTGETRVLLTSILLQRLDVPALTIGTGYQTLPTVIAGQTKDISVGGYLLEELSTHDEYMTVLIKTGALGLLVFIAILIQNWLTSNRIARRSKYPVLRTAFLHWHCALVGLYGALLAGEYLRYWPITVVFWMMAGGALNSSFQQNHGIGDSRIPPAHITNT